MNPLDKISSELSNQESAFNLDAAALGKEHIGILKLQIGTKAPNFTLLNTNNEYVRLYDVLNTKRVVLTFYRGTWCPTCNYMLVQYQAVLPEIEKTGAVLIAISPQTPDESLNIKEKNGLQFEILSDNGNIVTKKFTTIHKNPKKTLDKMTEIGFDYDSYYADEGSEIPIPATFIIGKNRLVSFAKTAGGDYRNRVDASEIIEALNQ